MAARRGILFGGSADLDELEDEPFSDLLYAQSSITAALNDTKMTSVHFEEGSYYFDEVDALVANAQAAGIPFRLHPLVWHESNAQWFLDDLSAGTWDAMMSDYINTLAPRWNVHTIDVLNEPLAFDGSGYRTDSPWYVAASGPSYIARAFELARAANPTARLNLCEFDVDYLANKRGHFLTMLEGLVATGNIDGVSIQGHLSISRTYDFAAWGQLCADLKAMGLTVDVNELDVRCDDEELSAAEFDRRAYDLVEAWVGTWVAAKCGSALLCWGLSDKYSWIHDFVPSYTQRPLPFDVNFNAKSMVAAIKSAFRNN